MGTDSAIDDQPQVSLSCRARDKEVVSILKPGVSEADFNKARDNGFWARVNLAFKSPFVVYHQQDLIRTEILGRRRYFMFGRGDIAFYDLASKMVSNICPEDTLQMSREMLGEKGFLNTFNHVVAQAFMTTLFSEDIADFVADVHERNTMPSLITGKFTEQQRNDIYNGAADNYLDMINNEWGQWLGYKLRQQFFNSEEQYWTPTLMAAYLNELQSYHSEVFQICFNPFRETDDIVVRFTDKINRTRSDLPALKKFYKYTIGPRPGY